MTTNDLPDALTGGHPLVPWLNRVRGAVAKRTVRAGIGLMETSTPNGTILSLKKQPIGAEGGTSARLHPFEIYAVSESGDPEGSTRWRVAPGWVEWRKRFADPDLASNFSDGVLADYLCHEWFYFPGTTSSTDLVIQNATNTEILLTLFESDSNPGEPTLTVTAPGTGNYGPGGQKIWSDNSWEWYGWFHLGFQLQSAAGVMNQLVTTNLHGFWSKQSFEYVELYQSDRIYYPGDILWDGLRKYYFHLLSSGGIHLAATRGLNVGASPYDPWHLISELPNT